ncbi:TonB-dependent receptor [Aestuariicella hydrocarbonica]|uniref:TonB-dependent receptor n=1 Tax=Pseudomaricurvus hydrocarbonicus TaxID=1470433 RepID=A0A9E5JY70_9GAMM|nr:TonB-dependent receptor [Aestuariicella hydrocarbonica]NHO64262.1 TonB-dependent receptor [Aestuariicella hydrocarbonica]
MKHQTLLAATIASLISSPLLATAAVAELTTSSRSDSDVEEMVVTATRIEQPLHKVLASVEILDRTAIANSTARNMVELLGQVPGVDIETNGSRGSTSSLFLRGTNSDHVLILIDGVRSASATSGTTAMQQIPMDQIERIEVVKGPRASLYGADAIGGVIQVFTRRGQEEPQAFIASELGSDALVKVSAGVSGGTEQTKATLTLAYEDTDGFDSTNKDGSANDDDDGYEEQSLSLSLDHTFANDWQVGFSALRVESEADYDGGLDSYSDSLNQTLNARLLAPLTDDLTVTLNLSESRDESESFATYPSEFNTQREMATVQADYLLAAGNVVSLGYDYYEDQVTSTTAFTVDQADNKAVFLQYQGEVQRVLLTASYRSDDHESFGRNNTKTVAVGYPIADNTLLSVSYGTAFKAPTFNNLYYPYEAFSYSSGYVYEYSGNLELQPEESESVEVLLRSQWQGVSWHVSYYETQVDDLIDLGTVGTVNTPVNFSEVKITGAELGADFTLLGWRNSLALSYTDPRDEETGDMLRARSRGVVSWALDRRFGDVEVAALWKAQSYRYNQQGRRLSGFNTLDLRGSYEVTDQLQLTAKVSNLFDVDYVLDRRDSSFSSTIYQTPGRQFSVAARYQF